MLLGATGVKAVRKYVGETEPRNKVLLLYRINYKSMYSLTSLYSRDRDSKNGLAYNEFAYKKNKDDCILEDRFQKEGHSGSHIHEIEDKKTAYNEGRLYIFTTNLQ